MRPLPSSLARPVLRRQWTKVNSKRFASTNANPSVEAAQKKAQDALASASKNAEKLLESSKKYIGPAGDAAGKMLGSYKQPIIYNLSVARELVKQVYHAEALQPPNSVEAIKEAYKVLWSRASNPAYWRGVVNNGEVLKLGIYALEAYGIFKIGEMLGRRSIVGYNIH
ncbi:mitochondrial ATP synthase g subunit-domain-containing protein [Mycena floridula]|nr:mitochondrial ATP synthase g subunit-domain-containing protein [Mycena floridula]